MTKPKPSTDAAREAAIRPLRYELGLPAESIAKLRDALASTEEQPTDSTAGMVRDALLADAMVAEARSQASRQLVPDSGRGVVPLMRSNAEMGLPPSWLERAGFTGTRDRRSWLEQLGAIVGADTVKREEANRDAWLLPLQRLRGKVGIDGVERVSSQQVMDHLGLARNQRGAGASRRLAPLMAELGWTAVRIRGLNRAKHQVRGYGRKACGVVTIRNTDANSYPAA